MIKIGIEIGIDTGDIRHILLMKDIKPSVSGYSKMQTVFVLYRLWGVSSVGRASVLQAEGRRFETCTLHLYRLNESGESASLTRKKLGVRSSQSVLDH